MKKLTTLLGLLLIFNYAKAEKVSGIITDRNGETIPFVSIAEKGTTNGVMSDADGRFNIQVKTLPTTLAFNCVGFNAVEQSVSKDSEKITVEMEEETSLLNEVHVVAKGRSRTENVIIGVENIQMAEMAKMPSLMGERDIIKSIQLLPGIKSEGDGSCGFQVRGGTAAQNLILIDNAPIYNAGHLMGVFSTFNDDALTNASLYKGAIPAQFGDASSSVFDIKTRSGDMSQYYGNVSIGLLSSKFAIDGPIVKDRASFFLSARRTYFEIFLKPTEKYRDKVLNFYDINSKITVKPCKNGTLNAMFFRGRDNMDMGNKIAEIHWGNTAAAVDYRHNFGNILSAKTSLIYSKYDFTESMNILKIKESFSGFLEHHTAREEVTASLGDDLVKLNVGGQFDHIDLKSGEFHMSNGRVERELRKGDELSFWAGSDWNLGSRVEMSAGVRGILFKALDAEFRKQYTTVEPRFSIKYQVTDNQSIKAGYCRTSQMLQTVLDNGMSSPIGRSIMASKNVKPQISDQVSAGYATEILDEKYELSVETYYKEIDNVYDYIDGKTAFSDTYMENLVAKGKGRAYGVECFAKKNVGDFTGWISYTLSWSENKVNGISNNRWYTAANDRRHDVSIVAMYKLNDKWDLSASWVYTSGQALTAPSAKYDLDDYTHYYYAERNGYRAPAYHRLDIGATNTKERARYTRIWAFGIYNLYNHYNPYVITFENDDEKASGTKTTQYSLFGLIPSVTYTIKF